VTNYACRASVLALFLILPLAACGPSAEGTGGSGGSGDPTVGSTQQNQPMGESCAALSSLSTEQGDLTARLRRATILTSKTTQFREPRDADLLAFERAFARLATQVDRSAVEELGTLGFEVSRFRTASGASWLLVQEKAPRTGAGTFAINLSPARDLWLELPHADSDEGTLAQGAEQVVELGARALLITGVNRCASEATTACENKGTTVCGGRLRTSDAAHFADNYFTAAHRALRSAFPRGIAVSLHGMETSGKEAAVVSDGTKSPRPGALSSQLRDAVNNYLAKGDGRAFSCNDSAESGTFRALCGSTNVQGRIDNGSGDACFADGASPQDRFIHVEQGPILRGASNGVDPVGRGLADTVPCSLPGDGLYCPVAATPACS
jgi:hypothetical protein